MTFTVRVTKSVAEGSTSVSSTVDHVCDVVTKLSEVIPDATVDEQFGISLTVADARAVILHSNQQVTIKTNDSIAPQETLNLLANAPIVWELGDAALFAGNVTSLFISNSSGFPATVKAIFGSNA